MAASWRTLISNQISLFQFKNCASQCMPVILEKFKEKKTNVVNALREAIDALYPCLGIEAVQVSTHGPPFRQKAFSSQSYVFDIYSYNASV
jgi:cytoskeleton-associated protein 5